jgi:hypothetical protein
VPTLSSLARRYSALRRDKLQGRFESVKEITFVEDCDEGGGSQQNRCLVAGGQAAEREGEKEEFLEFVEAQIARFEADPSLDLPFDFRGPVARAE